ncbi:MAG: glycosyltransferase [Thermofilaceae archaeon]
MLAYLAPCGMGLGHAGRMLSVARRLRQAGVDVVFSSYGRAADMIERSGYRCLRTRPVGYEVDEQGDIDVRRTIAKGPLNLYRFARQVGDELYYIGTLEPDVVVSDSRLSSLLAAKALGVPAVLVIHQLRVIIPVKKPTRVKLSAKYLAEEGLLRLLGKLWLLADEILIPDYPPPYTVARANAMVETLLPRARFVGPSPPVWPDELPPREEVRERLGVEGKLVVASFTGVSGEGRELCEAFLAELGGCDLSDEVVVIVSRGVPSGSDRLEKVGRNVYVCDWLPDRYLHVKAADALVTHGGHTMVMEAMAFGIPAVHVVRRTHTERLACSLSAEALGVAKTHIVGEGDLCSALRWALSDEAWAAAQDLASRLSQYRGDRAIAEAALKRAGAAL